MQQETKFGDIFPLERVSVCEIGRERKKVESDGSCIQRHIEKTKKKQTRLLDTDDTTLKIRME